MSRLHIGAKDEHEIDFELNIASIIDCFVVVITYLLLSASFIAIGAFDVGIAAQGSGSEATPPKPPEISVSVVMKRDHTMMLKISGKENRHAAIAPKAGQWDFENLTLQVQTLKQKYSDLNSVNVSGEPALEYQPLVKGIESVRRAVPTVFIGEGA